MIIHGVHALPVSIFVIIEVGILSIRFIQSLEMTICHVLVFVPTLLDQSYNTQNVFSLKFEESEICWYPFSYKLK